MNNPILERLGEYLVKQGFYEDTQWLVINGGYFEDCNADYYGYIIKYSLENDVWVYISIEHYYEDKCEVESVTVFKDVAAVLTKYFSDLDLDIDSKEISKIIGEGE